MRLFQVHLLGLSERLEERDGGGEDQDAASSDRPRWHGGQSGRCEDLTGGQSERWRLLRGVIDEARLVASQASQVPLPSYTNTLTLSHTLSLTHSLTHALFHSLSRTLSLYTRGPPSRRSGLPGSHAT